MLVSQLSRGSELLSSTLPILALAPHVVGVVIIALLCATLVNLVRPVPPPARGLPREVPERQGGGEQASPTDARWRYAGWSPHHAQATESERVYRLSTFPTCVRPTGPPHECELSFFGGRFNACA